MPDGCPRKIFVPTAIYKMFALALLLLFYRRDLSQIKYADYDLKVNSVFIRPIPLGTRPVIVAAPKVGIAVQVNNSYIAHRLKSRHLKEVDFTFPR